jgi:hypothetical protein
MLAGVVDDAEEPAVEVSVAFDVPFLAPLSPAVSVFAAESPELSSFAFAERA